MPKGYHHLTRDQRCQLYTLNSSGKSTGNIAEVLGVHRSTLYRELSRNKGQKGYRYQQAHGKALERKKVLASNKLKMKPELIALIENKLRLQWSPEQISGWLKRCNSDEAVSHESIYRHVWKDKRQGGNLYQELRHHGKKYNKRGSSKAGRGCIPGRIDIADRPAIVDKKSRLGDWELDTIIGREHKGAIVSMVERYSKLTRLAKIRQKTALEVKDALVYKLGDVTDCVHTMTSDNGKEFACHLEIAYRLGAQMYFARPYHSWERGLNEHTNGLVRQYLPKHERLDTVTQERVDEIENLLNNRPRKVLQFRTPIEVFNQRRIESAFVALRI
jgi:transposase, IS30 family